MEPSGLTHYAVRARHEERVGRSLEAAAARRTFALSRATCPLSVLAARMASAWGHPYAVTSGRTETAR